METEKKYPAYKGDGVAIWVNKDKNGNSYLSVKILNSATVNCWKFTPKPKEDTTL